MPHGRLARTPCPLSMADQAEQPGRNRDSRGGVECSQKRRYLTSAPPDDAAENELGHPQHHLTTFVTFPQRPSTKPDRIMHGISASSPVLPAVALPLRTAG